MLVKKIVLIGPESTGKSTLCKALATYFDTLYVEEYARNYLLTNGNQYTYEGLLKIAKGQIELEEKIIRRLTTKPGQRNIDDRGQIIENQKPETKNLKPKTRNAKLLFIDTDMYVMKVWCEFVFNQCHQWILDKIAERKYDLYLLCNIDLPWIKDGLREYPNLEVRKKLFLYYKDLLINQPVPWIEISGNYEERLIMAIKAVEDLL